MSIAKFKIRLAFNMCLFMRKMQLLGSNASRLSACVFKNQVIDVCFLLLLMFRSNHTKYTFLIPCPIVV